MLASFLRQFFKKMQKERPGQQDPQQEDQEKHLPPEPAGSEIEKLHEEAEHAEESKQDPGTQGKGTGETLGVP